VSAAKDRDLTQGPLLGHFKALAIPAAFGMLFATLYNVVDIYWAGRWSTDAQAGLAVGFQAFFIMMSIGFGLSAAMSALVSNAKGQKNDEDARAFAAQGITFGGIATAVLMVLGWFGGPYLIALVSEPGAYRDAATGYYQWLLFSLPGFLLAYGANGILQAHGDTVTMQRGLMVAFFANIDQSNGGDALGFAQCICVENNEGCGWIMLRSSSCKIQRNHRAIAAS